MVYVLLQLLLLMGLATVEPVLVELLPMDILLLPQEEQLFLLPLPMQDLHHLTEALLPHPRWDLEPQEREQDRSSLHLSLLTVP